MRESKKADRRQALLSLPIPNGKVTTVQFISAGRPTLIQEESDTTCPEHWRVTIALTPTKQSDIHVEVWLPTTTWNGCYLGTGNAGYAGNIDTKSLEKGIAGGFAVANTDMGSSTNPDDLLGRPEAWKDFGYRATHLMTTAAKQIIEAFYQRPPKHSYFIGGSTGGQQGLMEAQRYPEDYDGIVVFAPANNRTHLHTAFLWNHLALTEQANSSLTQKEATTIRLALTRQYRKSAGGAPGDHFLSYPDKISIDWSMLQQQGNLHPHQRSALEKIYHGAINPNTGERIFVPWIPGCEDSKLGLAGQSDSKYFPADYLYLFRWVFGKDYDYKSFDFHHDLDKINEVLAPILNANNPDLTAFKKKNGKLLMISGTADTIIPYTDNLVYYQRVVNQQGGIVNTADFFRFFIVPGLDHVCDGPGLQEVGWAALPSVPKDRKHNALLAMTAWVEKDVAPEALLPVAFTQETATKEIAFKRPVFPYPYQAVYTCGDPKKPENYTKEPYVVKNLPRPAEKYQV